MATGPVVTNFLIELLGSEGRKVCSKSQDHMTNMAVMPVHGIKPLKFFFSGNS